jgi:hypothetical protein
MYEMLAPSETPIATMRHGLVSLGNPSDDPDSSRYPTATATTQGILTFLVRFLAIGDDDGDWAKEMSIQASKRRKTPKTA